MKRPPTAAERCLIGNIIASNQTAMQDSTAAFKTAAVEYMQPYDAANQSIKGNTYDRYPYSCVGVLNEQLVLYTLTQLGWLTQGSLVDDVRVQTVDKIDIVGVHEESPVSIQVKTARVGTYDQLFMGVDDIKGSATHLALVIPDDREIVVVNKQAIETDPEFSEWKPTERWKNDQTIRGWYLRESALRAFPAVFEIMWVNAGCVAVRYVEGLGYEAVHP